MIPSIPRITYGEYERHFKSKVRVGKIADRFFSINYSLDAGRVVTFYEYQFPEAETERGKRSFIADIAVSLSDKDWYPEYWIDIEIDDFKHNYDKDKFRDYILLNEGIKMKGSYKKSTGSVCTMTDWEKIMHIPTLRIPGDLKTVDDSDIEKELSQFCKKNNIYLKEEIVKSS